MVVSEEAVLGLETGTYISDLVVVNPPAVDPINQGDDHIRLLKTVLKNTFPQASKPIYFPTAGVKFGKLCSCRLGSVYGVLD